MSREPAEIHMQPERIDVDVSETAEVRLWIRGATSPDQVPFEFEYLLPPPAAAELSDKLRDAVKRIQGEA